MGVGRGGGRLAGGGQVDDVGCLRVGVYLRRSQQRQDEEDGHGGEEGQAKRLPHGSRKRVRESLWTEKMKGGRRGERGGGAGGRQIGQWDKMGIYGQIGGFRVG